MKNKIIFTGIVIFLGPIIGLFGIPHELAFEFIIGWNSGAMLLLYISYYMIKRVHKKSECNDKSCWLHKG